jgi:hypothetical protein
MRYPGRERPPLVPRWTAPGRSVRQVSRPSTSRQIGIALGSAPWWMTRYDGCTRASFQGERTFSNLSFDQSLPAAHRCQSSGREDSAYRFTRRACTALRGASWSGLLSSNGPRVEKRGNPVCQRSMFDQCGFVQRWDLGLVISSPLNGTWHTRGPCQAN